MQFLKMFSMLLLLTMTVTAQAPAPEIHGTVNDVMIGIIYPSSNIGLQHIQRIRTPHPMIFRSTITEAGSRSKAPQSP